MIDQTILAWAIPGSVEATVKGDVEGHEFHGNQYTSGEGGGSTSEVVGVGASVETRSSGEGVGLTGRSIHVVTIPNIGNAAVFDSKQAANKFAKRIGKEKDKTGVISVIRQYKPKLEAYMNDGLHNRVQAENAAVDDLSE